MRVSVNGEIREFKAETLTIDKILEILGYKTGIAVALNETFIVKTKYRDTIVKDGDRLDILSPIQGG